MRGRGLGSARAERGEKERGEENVQSRVEPASLGLGDGRGTLKAEDRVRALALREEKGGAGAAWVSFARYSSTDRRRVQETHSIKVVDPDAQSHLALLVLRVELSRREKRGAKGEVGRVASQLSSWPDQPHSSAQSRSAPCTGSKGSSIQAG